MSSSGEDASNNVNSLATLWNLHFHSTSTSSGFDIVKSEDVFDSALVLEDESTVWIDSMFIPLYTEIEEQKKKGKLKLILDLDNTLIHCVVNPISPLAEFNHGSMSPPSSRASRNSPQTTSPAASPPNSPPLSPKVSPRVTPSTSSSSTSVPTRKLSEEGSNTYKNVHVMCLKGVVYYVKFRPGTSEFLRSMSRLYDIYLYTLAHRSYVKKVITMLGPAAQHIKAIVSRNDVPGRPSTKLLANISHLHLKDKENNYANVLILDDDKDCVWQEPDTANLVRIHPYFYFKESFSAASIANAGSGSAIKRGKELGLFEAYSLSGKSSIKSSSGSSISRQHDRCLYNSIIELMEIHNTYYSVWDVKASISLARAPVLQKLCILVLNPSGQKYPKFQQNAKALAESMGATVILELPRMTQSSSSSPVSPTSSGITHVISSPWTKEEVARQALNAGVSSVLVSFQWLVECHKRWERLDERPFVLSTTTSLKTDHIINDLQSDGLF